MVRLIAAIDSKRGLAKANKMPWNLPTDAKRFRDLTLSRGANVLMGRTTYEQMGGYLKHRHNYVLTRKQMTVPENTTVVHDINYFIANYKEDLWIIGGAEVFNLSIQYGNELYLTEIDRDFNCDRFFPDYSNFKLAKTEGPFSENSLTFSFKLYIKG